MYLISMVLFIYIRFINLYFRFLVIAFYIYITTILIGDKINIYKMLRFAHNRENIRKRNKY